MHYITLTDTTTDAQVTVEHDAVAIRAALGGWFDDELADEMDHFAQTLQPYGPAKSWGAAGVSTPVAPADPGSALGVTWQRAPIPLLDLGGVAERLGLSYATVRRYRSQDESFPEPDALLGQSPGWLPETIDRWQASRPGRGVGGGRPRKV